MLGTTTASMVTGLPQQDSDTNSQIEGGGSRTKSLHADIYLNLH